MYAGIVSRSSAQFIISDTAIQFIDSGVAFQIVVTCVAIQGIIAATAKDQIISIFSIKLTIPFIAVAAKAIMNQVIPILPHHNLGIGYGSKPACVGVPKIYAVSGSREILQIELVPMHHCAQVISTVLQVRLSQGACLGVWVINL